MKSGPMDRSPGQARSPRDRGLGGGLHRKPASLGDLLQGPSQITPQGISKKRNIKEKHTTRLALAHRSKARAANCIKEGRSPCSLCGRLEVQAQATPLLWTQWGPMAEERPQGSDHVTRQEAKSLQGPGSCSNLLSRCSGSPESNLNPLQGSNPLA